MKRTQDCQVFAERTEGNGIECWNCWKWIPFNTCTWIYIQ